MPKATTKSKASASSTKLKMVKLGASNVPRRFDPLAAYSTSSQGSQSSSNSSKGKEKQKSVLDLQDDRLWVDIYEPSNEAELAVHVKKVQDVRNWLQESLHGGPSGKLRKYRKVLALTGPSGAAKTITLRILAQEMGFNILEWKNGSSETSIDGESLSSKFDSFLARAASCSSISSTVQQQVILLEDLPNVLHSSTQERFHAALQAHVTNAVSAPVVVIISDAGVRGESLDEGYWREKESVMDVRLVMGKTLLNGPYVTKINFNPIAPTLMRKALNALLSRHYDSSSKGKPNKDAVEAVIDGSNGDIRSAIMALQFSSAQGTKSKRGKGKSMSFEVSTRRESSLALFHLLGKILYNKRKGDKPSNSLTVREKELERELDARLQDPDDLPEHLVYEHERRPSRVNIDSVYAESPVDSSLFSLYLHQNYTQFCDDVEECEGISETLSLVDILSSSSTANPHRFHLLTLGTLHSLPVPVERRGQKMFKPEWFNINQRTKEVNDDMEDVILSLSRYPYAHGRRNQAELAVEFGGWLKAHPLHSTTTFWTMKDKSSSRREILDELAIPGDEEVEEGREVAVADSSKADEDDWWKDADDIVDWE